MSRCFNSLGETCLVGAGVVCGRSGTLAETIQHTLTIARTIWITELMLKIGFQRVRVAASMKILRSSCNEAESCGGMMESLDFDLIVLKDWRID